MRCGSVPDLGKTNTVAIGAYHKIWRFGDWSDAISKAFKLE